MGFFLKGLTEKHFYKQVLIVAWGGLAILDIGVGGIFFKGWMFISFILFLCFLLFRFILFKYQKEDYFKKNSFLYEQFIENSKKDLVEKAEKDKNFHTLCLDCLHYDKKNKNCSLDIRNLGNTNIIFKTGYIKRNLCLLWNRNIPKELASKKIFFEMMLKDIKVGQRHMGKNYFSKQETF